jgi:hypothetical protein
MTITSFSAILKKKGNNRLQKTNEKLLEHSRNFSAQMINKYGDRG